MNFKNVLTLVGMMIVVPMALFSMEQPPVAAAKPVTKFEPQYPALPKDVLIVIFDKIVQTSNTPIAAIDSFKEWAIAGGKKTVGILYSEELNKIFGMLMQRKWPEIDLFALYWSLATVGSKKVLERDFPDSKYPRYLRDKLVDYIRKNDLLSLAMFLGGSPDFIKKNQDPRYLEYAVDVNPRKEIVGLLLNAGADPNLKTQSGDTPLMRAVSFVPDDKIVKLLVEVGADPNIEDNEGRTALIVALQNVGYRGLMVPIIRLLLEAGADPDKKTKIKKSGILGGYMTAWDYVKGKEEAPYPEIRALFKGYAWMLKYNRAVEKEWAKREMKEAKEKAKKEKQSR